MHQRNPRPPLPGHGLVENYTMPFLVVSGVLFYITLVTLWANFGLAIAVIVAALSDRAITWKRR